MNRFFVQNPVLPYVGLKNLQYTYIWDLTDVDEETKKYTLNSFVILNTLFDMPKLRSDLGMAYYSLVDYFKSKSFLRIVTDDTGQLYKQCKVAVLNVLSNVRYLLPVGYNIQTNNIIRSNDDFSDRTKVLETSMLLAYYYCKPSFNSISFDYVKSVESGGFVPGD